VEGDARGFRIAVCADALVNPEPGGLDALEVCRRTGFGVMQFSGNVRARAEIAPELF